MTNTQHIALRVAQASLNQTAFDFPRNWKNITEAIDKAIAAQSDVLAFEEMTLTGYDAGDDFQKTDNAQMAELLRSVAAYAAERDPNLVISLGHPYYWAEKKGEGPWAQQSGFYNRKNLPFNVQSLIGGGRVLAMTAKAYLYNDERGYEKRYFAEWPEGRTVSIHISGQEGAVPFGRPVLTMGEAGKAVRLAHVICEEKWVGTRFDDPSGTDRFYETNGVIPDLQRRYGKDGLVVLIPNASPPASLKIDKHVAMAKLASDYADLVVDTDGLGSSGSSFAQTGSRLVAREGQIATFGKRFSFARCAMSFTDASVRTAKMEQVDVPHVFRAAKTSLPLEPASAWDRAENPSRALEEIVRMNALWLFDVVRKTKVQGLVEALSGGADSAYNTALAAIMVRLAITELGVEGFCREMKHLRYLAEIRAAQAEGGTEAAIRAATAHFVTAIYLGTRNNPESSRNAAKTLAEGLGVTFLDRGIQDLLETTAEAFSLPRVAQEGAEDLLRMVRRAWTFGKGAHFEQELAAMQERARAFGHTDRLRAASDPRDQLTFENVQARLRQVLVMMVANDEGKMAMANPNLDEARNAYATFGGDLHSGTINPNGFLPKAQTLEILRHLAKKGMEGIPRLQALGPTLAKKPSAELLPLNAKGEVAQTDEAALQRSFAQMDRISTLMLRDRAGAYAERRLNPTEVFEACQKDDAFAFAGGADLYNMVRLSYERWGVAQHKIHAAPFAPTFGANVDHQVSLRTPNLSGNSRSELTQLGVKMLFARGQREACAWALPFAEKEALQRAVRDEDFVDAFEKQLRIEAAPNRAFDLDALFKRVNAYGFSSVLQGAAP